ncbi:MAG: Holliday junction branch migration DNA helicase RuvB, partial [Actinobacteria bacterium]|nr:Holliday junction branch migration DNA helicase RuvB [Actinomycetota bacterium]
MSDRIVDPEVTPDEVAIEGALRPKQLSDFVGQDRVKQQLGL